jgi:methyltransferase
MMKSRGAYEVGNEHYKYIVGVHVFFFISLFAEYHLGIKGVSPFWPILLPLFIGAQVVRVWALNSLGEYWNTKIIIVPNAKVVSKGPYKYIRHPNYLIVGVEILTIPLLFQCYLTAAIFTILNIIVLSIRIPVEERALMQLAAYQDQFKNRKRFVPVKTYPDPE